MALPLATGALMSMALLCVLLAPYLWQSVPRLARDLLKRAHGEADPALAEGYDPGRELRAEQRARALLRSCVNDEEWAMFEELGLLRVVGGLGERSCAYLIYPHRPILAYNPRSGVLLGEYCVQFPDHTRPYGSERLPDADDVLAKWIALTTDERGLLARANLHLPGRQIPLSAARRDLARIARWDASRGGLAARVGSVLAP